MQGFLISGHKLSCVKVKVKSLSCVWLFETPWTVACQAPVSMKFSRQEYWSGLPFPIQGIFPTQGSNPHLLSLLHWHVGSLPLAQQGKPRIDLWILKNSCITGVNPTYSWCMIHLMYYWILLAGVLLRIFVSMFVLLRGIFVWFWYQGEVGSQDEFGSVPPSVIFLE